MAYVKTIYSGAAALASMATMAATQVSAQDISGDPSFGTVTLSGGFVPDPHTVEVLSGGSVDAAKLGSSCQGYIANTPDVRLSYSAGSLPLTISASSNSDTTLVVNAPNGSWYCDDDSGDGVNPLIRFSSPQSGRYEIWIGTYSDSSMQNATLSISELGETASAGGGSADLSATPSFGTIELSGGFTPDPYRVNLRSGGSVSAGSVSSGCSGYIASAPDVRLQYDAGSLPLLLSVDADADTTLVVNDPNGNWLCDDDSGDGTNPALRLEKPASGQYDIWVGTYSDNSYQEATLVISELYSE